MDHKITSEYYTGPAFYVGRGYMDVLPSWREVDALETALLVWRRSVESRYGTARADQSWRRACRVVIAFERGES